MVTELSGLGDSLEHVGAGGRGFSRYKSIIDSTRAILGVEGREDQGLSMLLRDDDDGSRRSDRRSELERDDMSTAERHGFAKRNLEQQEPQRKREAFGLP